MQDFLIVLSTAVILPISIVFLHSMRKRNSDNKRAEILIKAIEAGSTLDVDKLADSLKSSKKSEEDVLSRRLLWGCIYTFLGIAFLINYLIGEFSAELNYSSKELATSILIGLVGLALGLANLTAYFVTRKSISDKH